jgi:hypothetical protein
MLSGMGASLGQSIGGNIGGNIGAMLGSSLGQFAGSLAGHAIDQKLFGAGDRYVAPAHGPRLANLTVQSSAYGNMIPIVYGRVRAAGNIIWAAPIKEHQQVQTHVVGGGKGGKIRRQEFNYSYTVSFAIAVCEGPIRDITNIFVDNEPLDLQAHRIRIYLGDEEQKPDPLIEAQYGIGQTPAYRGLAYVVFEDMPLADFGNHIPTFTFEVVSKIQNLNSDQLEDVIESVVIIPGGGEFVYDTIMQSKSVGDDIYGNFVPRGPQEPLNHHTGQSKANSLIALDQLQRGLPNVKWTAPVVTWFATNLDAETAEIKPGVEYSEDKATRTTEEWTVAGYKRSTAHQISKQEGQPRYGGTPSDTGIVRYLGEMKRRGYKIMFYPMPFVDHESKPWRGRISGNTAQIKKFFTGVNGYNRFILHYANLVKGKVDAFVIGSEMVGLTRVQDPKTKMFPAVEELIDLAKQVKAILGPHTLVTYAADWSEYHHTDGGWYNLDALWACEAIDFIGIDAYFPLTDEPQESYDLKKVIKGWTSGEGYDYYYEDAEARIGKKPLAPPYAWKNIEWWWSNQHVNPDGVATAWVPKSKKIWFTEYGFASLDGCTNQPNVFYDPASAEGNLPRYSKGKIDFQAQRLGLLATEKKWRNSAMIERKFVWCWDARPYPYWPNYTAVWADGPAWEPGHWIQGKLGLSSLAEIVADLCSRAGIAFSDIDVNRLQETVEGMVIASPTQIRRVIEGLQSTYFFDAVEYDNQLHFLPRFGKTIQAIANNDLVPINTEKGSIVGITRLQELELPQRVNINFIDQANHYQQGNQHSSRMTTPSLAQIALELPIVMTEVGAKVVAEVTMYNLWMERTRYSFALTIKYAHLTPGDVVEISLEASQHQIRLTDTYIGKNGVVKVEGVAENLKIYDIEEPQLLLDHTIKPKEAVSDTRFEILDLPALPNDSYLSQGYIMVAACGLGKNWKGAAVYASSSANSGYKKLAEIEQPATLGYTAGVLGRASSETIDYASKLQVNMVSGNLASVTEVEMLAGENFALIGDELIYFKDAKLIAEHQYELSGFLRGRQSTENKIAHHTVGERFVLLNSAMQTIEMGNYYIGKEGYLKVVSIGKSLAEAEACKFTYQANSLRPFAPINLRVQREAGDSLKVSWSGRNRLGVDLLAEGIHRYLLSSYAADGTLLSQVNTDRTMVVINYAAAVRKITVAQVSLVAGVGFAAEWQGEL